MNIKHEIPHFVRNDKFGRVDYRRVFGLKPENPPTLKWLIVIPNGACLHGAVSAKAGKAK